MKNIFKKKPNGKTILILSECQQGALKAGRYALKHLFDNQTRIILLRPFQAPKFGLSMMRNLSSVLKDISKEDLTVLKNTFIKEEVGLEVNVELVKADNRSMHDVVLSHIGELNGPGINDAPS